MDHNILIAKLKLYGFDKRSLDWIKSYLSNRTQRVSISGELSKPSQINRGTPQGSRISPILFLVLMSDMNLQLEKGILTNFADDTQLATIEESEEIARKNTTVSEPKRETTDLNVKTS